MEVKREGRKLKQPLQSARVNIYLLEERQIFQPLERELVEQISLNVLYSHVPSVVVLIPTCQE